MPQQADGKLFKMSKDTDALFRHLFCKSPSPGQKGAHLMWKMGVEQYCQGCLKQHNSILWYYRTSDDGTLKEWMCGLRYLVLDAKDMDLWKALPVFY
jgi:hypothetical protein